MTPIDPYKKEAIEKGLTQYFNGKPCLRGHIAKRAVSNSECTQCRNDRSREYRFNNLEAQRERGRKNQARYQKAHPEVKRKAQSKRRARARNAEGQFSVQEIFDLLIKQKHRCSICDCDLNISGYQIDHKTPLSRGGSNWISNIQLLCPKDNRQKNASTDEEYRAKLGLSVV